MSRSETAHPEVAAHRLGEVDPQGMDHDVQVLVDVVSAGGGAQLGIGHNEGVPLAPALVRPPHGQHGALLRPSSAAQQPRRIPHLQALHPQLDLACSKTCQVDAWPTSNEGKPSKRREAGS